MENVQIMDVGATNEAGQRVPALRTGSIRPDQGLAVPALNSARSNLTAKSKHTSSNGDQARRKGSRVAGSVQMSRQSKHSGFSSEEDVAAAKAAAAKRKKKFESSSSSSSSSDSDSESSSSPRTVGLLGDAFSAAGQTVEAIGALGATATKGAWRWLTSFGNGILRLKDAPKNPKECMEHASLFVLTPDNTFRIIVYNVAHHKVFEGFVILVIAMNCVVLALDDPTTSEEPEYQSTLDIFFTVVFSFEMVVKMLAFGVAIHPGSYFRDSWNWLDFSIVAMSYLQQLPNFGNFTAFRTIRVLRPLRSMTVVPPLKTMVTCLAHSVKGLANVLVLALFIFMIFAILSVQLWMGNLRNRCAYGDGTIAYTMMCTTTQGGSAVGASCPDGMNCVDYGNPNFDYTSFDSVPWAFMIVFQTITLESWSTLMYLSMDACGWPAAIYFVLVVIIGCYFVLNLCLAVISFHFELVKERTLLKEVEAAQKEESHIRQSEEGILRARASLRLQPEMLQHMTLNPSESRGDTGSRYTSTSDTHRVVDPRNTLQMEDTDRYHLARQLPHTCPGNMIAVVHAVRIFGAVLDDGGASGNEDPIEMVDDGVPAPNIDIRFARQLQKYRPMYGKWHLWITRLYRIRLFVFQIVDGNVFDCHIEQMGQLEVDKLRLLNRIAEAEDLKSSLGTLPTTWFATAVFFCVVLNTTLMAASHFHEDQAQTDITDLLNVVFSYLFFGEMVIKHFAYGPYWYWQDKLNAFDGIVTIISMVEVWFLSGSSDFSVFRALRLLRVVRLMQGVKSLRQLTEVFAMAAREGGFLFVILGLHFLMASLIGMQLFADELQLYGTGTDASVQDTVQSSFVNFLQAFYTVMQILTYDSWPDIMWNAMYASSEAAMLYFIGCIVVGNLIVLNLLVAILIDTFEQYAKKHTRVATKRADPTLSSEDDSDDEVNIRRGIKITILSAEPEVPKTTLLPRGANDFLAREFDKVTPALLGGTPPKNPIAGSSLTAIPNKTAEPAVVGIDPAAEGDEMASLDKADSVAGDEGPTVVCDLCGEIMERPFPPISMSIASMSMVELHDRMCERIQFRKVKERMIKTLIESMVSLDDSSDSDDEDAISPRSQKKLQEKDVVKNSGLSDDAPLHMVPFEHNDDYNPFSLGYDAANVESRDFTPDPVARGNNIHTFLSQGRFPTPSAIEDLFGRAWEVGLLLGDNAEDYLHCKSWKPVKRLLRREFQLLQLKIGEEQIGRALIAYTRANVPNQILTNGGEALFLFGPRNPLRQHITALVTSKWFDYSILAIIVASSILIALDNRSNSAELSQNISTVGNAFTVIFCAEMILKSIALGFYFHHRAYLRDAWNWLDFIIVLVSVVSWIVESQTSGTGVGALKVLRTLRVLRPLRLINRYQGLRMVVLTLIESVKGIANMSLILFLVYLSFAILGVQMFGGVLWSCSDGTNVDRVNCTGMYNGTDKVMGYTLINQTLPDGTNVTLNVTTLLSIPVLLNRTWINANFHFDDTLNAFLALFHTSTLDNWGSGMYAVINGVDYDHGSVPWNNPTLGLYFVAFVLVGAIFMLNMFIGLIISNFETTKAQLDGVSLLTDDQKLWVETQRMMLNFRPQRLRRAGRLKIQQTVAHSVEEPWFELASAVVVFLNIIFIAIEHYDQPEALTVVLDDFNIIFTALFCFEASCKILAYDLDYFMDSWNRFDFFIVILGLFDVATGGNLLPINVGLIRILRVFRIARILAVVRKARDIRVLLETLWYSIPSLANIGAFMFLTLFVFAVLGVQIFGSVARDNNGLTAHMNFENFGTAFLFLIQVTTLDNWGQTMASLSVTTDCKPSDSADGLDHCGTSLAPLFFIPFILISSYVVVNLFCAIILDNFSTTMELDQSDLKVADLKKFAEAWAHFDPDATMLTKTKNFPNLLAALKPPLGIERKTDRHKLLKIAREYVIPEHEGDIHFVETLIPLARKTLGVEFTDEEIRDHEEQWRKHFPDLNHLRVIRYRQKRVTVDQYFAATYIAGAFRRRLARKVVAVMRRDKRDDLLTWYEDHDIPEHEMHAVMRMDREERERVRQMQANMRMIDEVVMRQRLQSNGGNEDDLDEEDGAETAGWQEGNDALGGLVGTFAREADDKPRPPANRDPLTRRQSLQRRESAAKIVTRRRQSLGLTGFTHLWAAHAAEI